MLIAGVLLAAAMPARGEIIDRIAVSVGNRVITVSDIDREIRVTAFLDGKQPDVSPAGKRAMAERMIEQKLIQHELETSRYPVPSPSEVEAPLAEFKRNFYPNEDDYRRGLQKYGITDQDVRAEVLWERTMLLFLNIRFQADNPQASDHALDTWLRDARKRTEIIYHEEAFQ